MTINIMSLQIMMPGRTKITARGPRASKAMDPEVPRHCALVTLLSPAKCCHSNSGRPASPGPAADSESGAAQAGA